MALVSDPARAILVGVSVLPETPEDSRYGPCSRCSFVGVYTKMTVGDWVTYPLCETCAAIATLAGEDVHSMTNECPVCDRQNGPLNPLN